MKKIKIFMVSILVVLCLSLTACDPASFYFDYDELKEKVTTVELISYNNINLKMVKDESKVLPFDFDKMEIVETLESKQRESFLSELSKIYFHVSDNLTKYSNSATGISIRIIYASGDFVVICSNTDSNFVGGFTAHGHVGELMARFTSHQDFVDIVNKFFDTQIT